MSRNQAIKSINSAKKEDQSSIRPTRLTIDLDQLASNYHAIQEKVGDKKVMAVLKANAYGHGIVEIGRFFEQIGIPYFSVAYLEEAIELRQAGIKTPILVFGGIVQEQIDAYLENQLTITAPSVEKLQMIDARAAELGVRAMVHLIFDTGMERLGVHYYNARELIQASLNVKHSFIEGIYTHYANADTADLTYSQAQLDRFKQILAIYPEIDAPVPPLRHMANSGGVLQLEDSWFDMVRPGILMYGVYPSAEVNRTIQVKPVLRWTSRVVYFKVVQPGHPVSYGSTWKSDEPVRVVTLPVGYGDGYFRALSNKASVLIRGQHFPVIGRVCMDQTMVNIADQSAYNGDEVVLLGEDEFGNGITIESLAEWADTIPYEVLTSLSRRVPRVYLGGE